MMNTKTELAEQIANDLLVNDLLNEIDCPSAGQDARDIILKCLQDYIVIVGQVLED